MVTKVVFTFGTRGVFIIRSKQSDLHDDYGGNLPLYYILIVLNLSQVSSHVFSVVQYHNFNSLLCKQKLYDCDATTDKQFFRRNEISTYAKLISRQI